MRQAALSAVMQTLGGGGAAPTVTSAKARPAKGKKPAVKAAAVAKAAPKAKAPAKKAGKKSGGRRSPAEIEATAQKILAQIKGNPGRRSEEIKKSLGLSKAEWMLPISRLVEAKLVTAKGEKRATTYTANSK